MNGRRHGNPASSISLCFRVYRSYSSYDKADDFNYSSSDLEADTKAIEADWGLVGNDMKFKGKTHRDLEVWKRSISFVTKVYQNYRTFSEGGNVWLSENLYIYS